MKPFGAFLATITPFFLFIHSSSGFPKNGNAPPVKAPEPLKTKVLILGGGMSGITAAHTLQNKLGISDFLILEGRPEIGGRMKSAKIGSTTIEFGANWIQGLGSNPIWTLAQKYDVKNILSEWDDVTYFTGAGYDGPKGKLAKAMETYGTEIHERSSQEAGRRETLGLPDLSMKAGLNIVGWNPQTPEEKAAEYFHHDWEMGEPPIESSFIETINSYNASFVSTGNGDNNLCIDPRGFKQIIVGQAKEIENFDKKILLNQVVNKIEYSAKGVRVSTKTGLVVEAEYALCTFSLGVLQNKDVTFEPPLPEWKREGYAQFHMATYLKIFARFPYKFWNSSQFTVYADPDRRGYYPIWQSLDEEGFAPGSKVLFATLTGDEAYEAELQSDEDTKKQFMGVLRKMYGNDIPEPVEFKYPRWTLDPLFRGTFTNWGAGVTEKQQDDMRAPLGDPESGDGPEGKRLFFAGEHTSRAFFGYLQGAYWEGKLVSHKISDCVKNNCYESEDTSLVKREADAVVPESSGSWRFGIEKRRMWGRGQK